MTTKRDSPKGLRAFIKEQVIPEGMTVADAARALGVSRPTLSRLLNGHIPLSRAMALRMARIFDADAEDLLRRQGAAGRGRQSPGSESASAARVAPFHVPPFLEITARDITHWAATSSARDTLSVLVRTLVNSTTPDLRRVDFPGYDNAERPGWDGQVEAGVTTPWVPEGISGWELSAEQEPSGKASRDLGKGLKNPGSLDPTDTTFVFVTPHNWRGRKAWVQKHADQGVWKDVRAYDAEDLAQWIAQSLPAQIWLAGQLPLRNAVPRDVQSLDHFWSRWAAATRPPMPPALFARAVANHVALFSKWLHSEGDRPFVITGPSRDECLAFLACLFHDPAIETHHRDVAAIIHSPRVLNELAISNQPFVPIVSTDGVEQELPALGSGRHCIVVRRRRVGGVSPDIALGPIGPHHVAQALNLAGLPIERARQLTRQSGGSPAVLRRLLCPLDAIRRPPWADNAELARRLIPFALTGAWNEQIEADREFIASLTGTTYTQAERDLAQLLHMEDSPLWYAGTWRGIVSKSDALLAIAENITDTDLDTFFSKVREVLALPDPALELSPDERFAAPFIGKSRPHSELLRNDICDTLAMLAVHGDTVFAGRLLSVSNRLEHLLVDLFGNLKRERLESCADVLPLCAETAPRVFLDALKNDLESPSSVLAAVVEEAASQRVGASALSAVLHSLECLAWRPGHLTRIASILGQMARTPLPKELAHTPGHSLLTIFQPSAPQTAATAAERERALRHLVAKHGEVGWRLAVGLLGRDTNRPEVAWRPRWRDDAGDAANGRPDSEIASFRRAILDIVISWRGHTAAQMVDLIEGIRRVRNEERDLLIRCVRTWARQATDQEKARAGRSLRFLLWSLRRQRHPSGHRPTGRLSQLFLDLTPTDVVLRNAWSFALSDYLLDEDFARISQRPEEGGDVLALQFQAFQDIWSVRGTAGIVELLALDFVHPDAVARSAVAGLDGNGELGRLIAVFPLDGPVDCASKVNPSEEWFLRAVLASMDDSEITALLDAERNDAERETRLLRSLPISEPTWALVESRGSLVAETYWKTVYPYAAEALSVAERRKLVDRLLAVERAVDALLASATALDELDTERLVRLLAEAAIRVPEEMEGETLEFQHAVESAFQVLDRRPDVPVERSIQLEFRLFALLERIGRGTPVADRQIASDPAFFVQLVSRLYGRSDGGADPVEWSIANPEASRWLDRVATSVLERSTTLPGRDADGRINESDLLTWCREAQRLFRTHGRAEIGDQRIGMLLARGSSIRPDRLPPRAVCAVLERFGSRDIQIGFRIAVRNSRGIYRIDTAGTEQRALRKGYLDLANKIDLEYPQMAAVLTEIAEDYGNDTNFSEALSRLRQFRPFHPAT